jgi:addiction module HigA family antidote
MEESMNTSHPGTFIKEEIIPAGMSVTKAAQLVGVGRPALSNLLNGNSSLSASMAKRLEKAFKYPSKDLMEMQVRFDEGRAILAETPFNTIAYVPPFLSIKANDVEQWATNNIPVRSKLSVFLRTLVHSTGNGLTKVDFPGNDDSERPGWDGFVEASEGTPWIPKGISGWEFGTNVSIKPKADGDFDKSVKAIEEEMRLEITFVFVTPRRWAGKTKWVTNKKEQGLWKDVLAYDSSDIEQWLEQSLPAQAWFANEARIPAKEVRSLDKCWSDWANISEPPLSGMLFSSAIESAKRTMQSYLSKTPDGPIIISADSTDEALAFVSQLLGERGGDELSANRDRVLVFDKQDVLPSLAEGAQTFIPVIFTPEVERELAPFANTLHSIVISPRNAANAEPHIMLEPASYEAFHKALEHMGKSRDEVDLLEKESGRSLTVLRRRVANVPAVQTPKWSVDQKTVTSLVPFLFAGVWNSANEADRLVIELLADERPYADIERECQYLTQINEAPVWSIGSFRGVISKIDLLYAIAHAITPEDLTRFFEIARLVLGEDDPALDLTEDKRWAASIHGKAREFSGAFREGISETLVLLAVHGSQLFNKRLGVNLETDTINVIRELLPTPLTTRVLKANDSDLPTYAEAAPDEFLSILERDLKNDEPAVFGLLKPAGTGPFSSTSRTGLLWALEGLSWSPATLPRAALILARLAQIEINDNWVNKPANSLESIFRAWMPQTAASHNERIDLIKTLAKKFPDVAWRVCIEQIGNGHRTGDYSHKPRWRSDGYGYGEPFQTWDPIIDFTKEITDMVLAWENYSLTMLCDLVERIQDFDNAEQGRIWLLIEDWAKERANDIDKSKLREKIRVSTLSWRALKRANKKNEDITVITSAARNAYSALEPTDILQKHAWLFKDTWVEESADEIEDIEDIEEMDYSRREERINNQRINAMREIVEQKGVPGILHLACNEGAPWTVGILSASDVLAEKDLCQLLKLALEPIVEGKEDILSQKSLISGSLCAVNDDSRRDNIMKSVSSEISDEAIIQMLVLAPYRKPTWRIVDMLDESYQTKYWDEVSPSRIHDSNEENNEGVERLIRAERLRAAFSCIKYDPEKLDAELIYRLLTDIAQGSKDKSGEYKLDEHYLKKAFKHIDSSTSLSLEQKAGVEFAYIELLSSRWGRRGGNSIPNLERYIETHPEFFVQAIVWVYKRKDGAQDPAEFQRPAEGGKVLAEKGHTLLEGIDRIPGHNELGDLEVGCLLKWIGTVRQSSMELSRIDITDICIGRLLSCSPVGKDGVWPCEVVRDVMEDIQSEQIMRGACTGAFNSRGVTSRMQGEGGGQERDLADKYRKWSLALRSSHPYVASKLLMKISSGYEYNAEREDLEVSISQRLR